jgi:hypothetical protein
MSARNDGAVAYADCPPAQRVAGPCGPSHKVASCRLGEWKSPLRGKEANMNDATAPIDSGGSTSSENLNSIADPQLQILIANEVQRQLDRERLVLRDAGNLALKIIGGSFALFIAVFTIFGLNTWSGVSQAAKDYMQKKVDDLVGRSDSETSVQRTLNDLVNRAIVASELTAFVRAENKKIELPKYEWDRLKSWLKFEGLSPEDFSDTLAVLNGQSIERKTLDANGIIRTWGRQQLRLLNRRTFLQSCELGQLTTYATSIMWTASTN